MDVRSSCEITLASLGFRTNANRQEFDNIFSVPLLAGHCPVSTIGSEVTDSFEKPYNRAVRLKLVVNFAGDKFRSRPRNSIIPRAAWFLTVKLRGRNMTVLPRR